eukprot:2983081-Prymnesium_polylepis.2
MGYGWIMTALAARAPMRARRSGRSWCVKRLSGTPRRLRASVTRCSLSTPTNFVLRCRRVERLSRGVWPRNATNVRPCIWSGHAWRWPLPTAQGAGRCRGGEPCLPGAGTHTYP